MTILGYFKPKIYSIKTFKYLISDRKWIEIQIAQRKCIRIKINGITVPKLNKYFLDESVCGDSIKIEIIGLFKNYSKTIETSSLRTIRLQEYSQLNQNSKHLKTTSNITLKTQLKQIEKTRTFDLDFTAMHNICSSYEDLELVYKNQNSLKCNKSELKNNKNYKISDLNQYYG